MVDVGQKARPLAAVLNRATVPPSWATKRGHLCRQRSEEKRRANELDLPPRQGQHQATKSDQASRIESRSQFHPRLRSESEREERDRDPPNPRASAKPGKALTAGTRTPCAVGAGRRARTITYNHYATRHRFHQAIALQLPCNGWPMSVARGERCVFPAYAASPGSKRCGPKPAYADLRCALACVSPSTEHGAFFLGRASLVLGGVLYLGFTCRFKKETKSVFRGTRGFAWSGPGDGQALPSAADIGPGLWRW